MSRKSYDQWKIERTQYNKSLAIYVECDCGSLAKKIYNTSYFECPDCHKKYILQNGQYVEMRQ